MSPILLTKLASARALARAKSIVDEMTTEQLQGIDLCRDVGKTINYIAVRALLECKRFAGIGKDLNGKTILHCAAADGQKEICTLLLKHPEFHEGMLGTATAGVSTPVGMARAAGHYGVAKLLEVGVPVSKCAKLMACNGPAKAAVEELVSECDVRAMLCELTFANLRPDGVMALLKSSKRAEVLKVVDEDNWTLLHWAVYGGHYAVVESILQGNQFPMVNKMNDSGDTAFTLALRAGRSSIARLIAEMPLFNLRDNEIYKVSGVDHQSPADAAAQFPDCARMLSVWVLAACETFEDGAEIVSNLELDTIAALDLSRDFGFQRVNYHAVKAVLMSKVSYQVNINATYRGYTILAHAVWDGQAEIANLVLQRKDVDLSRGKPESSTLLHIAVRRNQVAMVQALLRHPQASLLLKMKDKEEKTALDCAKETRCNGPDPSRIFGIIEAEDAVLELANTSDVNKCREIVARIRYPLQCKVCMEQRCDRVLSACGHAICAICTGKLSLRRKCPFCSKEFTESQIRPLFLP